VTKLGSRAIDGTEFATLFPEHDNDTSEFSEIRIEFKKIKEETEGLRAHAAGNVRQYNATRSMPQRRRQRRPRVEWENKLAAPEGQLKQPDNFGPEAFALLPKLHDRVGYHIHSMHGGKEANNLFQHP
jgi:hypothetical protein